MTYEQLMKDYPWLFTNPQDCPVRIATDPGERAAIERRAAERRSQEGLPATFARTGVVYEDQYLMLLRDAVLFPSGKSGTFVRYYQMPLGMEGVAVLPRTPRGLALLRHFRHATRTFHLEVPRGFATANLSNADNARKELVEEIGAHCRTLTSLGFLDPNTGLSGTRVELFFAEVDRVGNYDAEEGIAGVEWSSVDQLERLIGDGTIADSFTIACYVRAKLRGHI